MECSHVAKDDSPALSLNLKDVLKTKLKNGLTCSVCNCSDSIWICTACGQLSCGRYAKAHSLTHYEQHQESHSVCMDCKVLSVYCYACDDFVINDSPSKKISQLRSILNHYNKVRSTNGNDIDDAQIGDEGTLEDEAKVRFRRHRSKSFDNVSGVENRPSSAKKSRKNSTQLKRLVGLRNLGNTCFMSAVLQSLGNIPEFCRVLKDLPLLKDITGNSGISSGGRETRTTKNGTLITDGPIMTEELRKVLVALNQELEDEKHQHRKKSNQTQKVISPEALFHVIWKVVPRFRGYQQQDAHEFLRYMLDRLHTELLSLLPGDLTLLRCQNLSPYARRRSAVTPTSHTLVTSIFGGTLQSEVTCLTCRMSSKKHDPFLDLSLEVPTTGLNVRRSKTTSTDPEDKKPCQLDECLQKFLDIEELAESEHWICGNCKTKQRSTKKFWIRRLPRVLCLHLKRFRWSTYSRTKIDTHVSFPLNGLDMSRYLLTDLHETRCSNAGSSLYDLAAVIVHHGSGAGSGHYTAFVIKNNEWYHFNDSTVLASEPETVALSKAYILFYIQRAVS